jgi:acid phosphatase (class A)
METRPFRLLALGVGAATAFAACLAVGQSLDSLGYLHGAHAPDTSKILQAAPITDSPRGVADRAIYKATRALKDTPRWALAQNDVNESIPAMLKDFSCGAGANLTETNAPRLAAMLGKVRADVLGAVNKPKVLYQRQRPYLIDEGEICVPKTDSLAKSPDYPSGHATWGWTVGLVLAEADPDRAAEILVRARAFGESRVVCGVHNASAIEAARTNASAVAATLNGDAAFRSDLEVVRGEIAAARAAGAPPAQACSAEAALTAATPW